MAIFAFGAEAGGLAPDESALAERGLARPLAFPTEIRIGTWLLEAMALTGLFLLLQGRSGAWWLDGLMTAAIAWVFRGPLMVLSLAQITRLPREPFWGHPVHWGLVYLVSGLVLAYLARRLGRAG